MSFSRSVVVFCSFVGVGCAGGSIDAVDGSSGGSIEQDIINGAACDGRGASALAIVLDATIDVGNGDEDVTRLMCTGTLIAPDVVLTAGHCTEAKLLTGGRDTVSRADFYVTAVPDLTILAGTETPARPLPDDAVPVRSFVAHEDFDITRPFSPGLGAVNDIALLFLDGEFDGVTPEAVISADEVAQLAVGTPVHVAGWGKQTADRASPDGTVGLKLCGETTIGELGDHEMQIGGGASSTRKCQGDSGGPSYVDVDSDSAVTGRVVGVTSHQYDGTGCAKGGIDTRVDAYLDWIDAKMVAGCADGSRVWCDVDGIVPAGFDFDAADEDAPKKTEDPPGCASAPTSLLGVVVVIGILLHRRRRRR